MHLPRTHHFDRLSGTHLRLRPRRLHNHRRGLYDRNGRKHINIEDCRSNGLMKKFASGLRLRRKRPEPSKTAPSKDRLSEVPDSICTTVPEAITVGPIGAQNLSSQTHVPALPQSSLSSTAVEQEGGNLLPVEDDERKQGH